MLTVSKLEVHYSLLCSFIFYNVQCNCEGEQEGDGEEQGRKGRRRRRRQRKLRKPEEQD
jgi:hypothetical protein